MTKFKRKKISDFKLNVCNLLPTLLEADKIYSLQVVNLLRMSCGWNLYKGTFKIYMPL